MRVTAANSRSSSSELQPSARMSSRPFLDRQIEIESFSLFRSFHARLLGDHDLVEPRRHRVDQLHVVDELGMILLGYLRADENGEMPDLGIDVVENPLAALPDLVLTLGSCRESSPAPAAAA